MADDSSVLCLPKIRWDNQKKRNFIMSPKNLLLLLLSELHICTKNSLKGRSKKIPKIKSALDAVSKIIDTIVKLIDEIIHRIGFSGCQRDLFSASPTFNCLLI